MNEPKLLNTYWEENCILNKDEASTLKVMPKANKNLKSLSNYSRKESLMYTNIAILELYLVYSNF